jgi:hypothetical protein
MTSLNYGNFHSFINSTDATENKRFVTVNTMKSRCVKVVTKIKLLNHLEEPDFITLIINEPDFS